MKRKLGLYFGIVVMLFSAIFVLSINNEETATTPNKEFVADKNFNIDEDLETPKIIFVYSDPTPHHPQG